MLKIFGDLHLTGNIIIDLVIIYFLKKNIKPGDIVIFLGDVFDNFDTSVKRNLFYKFISELDNDVYIILGNHDISKNRNYSNVIKDFSKRITIIEGYSFTDINNYRLHFLNYFRYNNDYEFQLHSTKNNILFTHCDLDVNNPFDKFKAMNLVVSGHVHNFEMKDKYIILGAVRKCKIDEVDDKKYMTMDLNDPFLYYDFIDFKSVIDIRKIHYTNLNDDLVFDRNTILQVLFSGYENKSKKEDIDKIKQFKWYKEDKFIIKTDSIKDDDFIMESLNDIQNNSASFDIIKIFDSYLDYYISKYKVKDLDKAEYIEVFNKYYNQIKKDIMNFKVNNIQFISAEAKNFRLFEYIKVNFDDYKNVVFIRGENHDELSDSEPSSNESGKSALLQLLQYGFKGTDSDIKPLRRGETSGQIIITLKINDDLIEFTRKFTKTAFEIHIKENNEPFHKDETNTNKLDLFFSKYNFLDALQFIFLCDNGFVNTFFTSKSNQKFQIFKDTFPIIKYISDIVLFIKEELGKEKEVYDGLKVQLDHKKEIRKIKYEQIKRELNEIKGNEVNSNSINCKVLILDDLKKQLDKPEIEKGVLDNVYDMIQDDEDYNFIKNIYSLNYDDVLNYFKIRRNIEILNNKLETNVVKDFKVDEELDKIVLTNLYEERKKRQLKIDMTGLEHSIFSFYIDNFKFENEANKKEELQLRFNKLNEIENERKNLSDKKVNDLKSELDGLKKKYKTKFEEINNIKKGIETNECIVCGSTLTNADKINEHVKHIGIELEEIMSQGKEKQKEYDKMLLDKENIDKEYEFYKMFNEEIFRKCKNNNIRFIDFIEYKDDKTVYLNDDSNYVILARRKEEYEKNKILFNEYKKSLEERDLLQNKIGGYNLNIDFTEEKFIRKYQDVIKINKYFSNVEICQLRKHIELNLGYYQIYNNKMEEIRILDQQLNIETELYNQIVKKKNKIKEEIESTQKEYSIRELNKRFSQAEKSYLLLDKVYYVLNNRGIAFDKYFINEFFMQIQKIFNVLLTFLFEREVKLEIKDMEFKFFDNGDECYYNDFSSGGKIKLSLAFLLTFNIIFQEYGTRSNLQWIDEFLDQALDEINTKRVFSLLKHYFNQKLFVVTHKLSFFEEFEHQDLVIVRREGKSVIKGGGE